MHVEFWKYGKYCVAFEDGEYLDGFLHNDKDDWHLIHLAMNFYETNISPGRTKH